MMDLLHGPVCPTTGSVLFRERGPFGPTASSVLSWNVVRFVLRRGLFCLVTWSVLSMVRFVRVPTKRWEILIFPRTVGNTGNSRELLVIPGNYWELSY